MSIKHIEDMGVEEFVETLKKLHTYIWTEKIDGANLWFGIDEKGSIFTSREGKRKGQRFMKVDDYAKIAAFDQFRAAHAALEAKEADIKQILSPGDMVEIEVLFGRQPNAVTYGANGKSYLAFLRGVEGTADAKVDQLASAMNSQQVTVKVPVVLSTDGEKLTVEERPVDFQFISAQKLDAKELQGINITKPLAAMEAWLKKPTNLPGKPTNMEVITSNLMSFDKDIRPEVKKLRSQLEAQLMADFKLPIKKELLDGVVRKLRSPLAADDMAEDEDIGIEGVVLRDPVSGEQIKIVDKDTFTTINQFNQSVRSMVSGVVRTTDMDAPLENKGGVMGEMKILMADLLGNKDLARTISAKKVLNIMKGNDPEDTIRRLSAELEGSHDFRATRTKVLALIAGTKAKLDELLKQFKAHQNDYRLKLKTGKVVGLTAETIRRTLTTFAEARHELDTLAGKIAKTKGLVQIVALLYGRHAKAVHAPKEEETVTEGEVIQAKFGKGVKNLGIEVPPGYDRFMADGKKIIGIRGKEHKVVSTTSDERLAQELVRIYNGGEASVTIKPMSLLQAFGSPEINIAHDLGIKFIEKPSYFEDIDQEDQVNELQLRRLKNELHKAGVALKTYDSSEIWGADPRGPLQTAKHMPEDRMAIVKMKSGKRYLIDTTGANTYIRMWRGINDDISEQLVGELEALSEKRIFTDKSLYANKDAWTILNTYFSVYMMAVVIAKSNDKPGIRLLRDKTHMRLTHWSREMSNLNFWGYPVWRSSSGAVKKLVGPKVAKELYAVVRHVPPALWKFLHIDMSFGKEVPIDYEEHRKALRMLQKHPGLMVDRINIMFDGVMRYEQLTHDEKIKLLNKLEYYVMQFNQQSPLLVRLRSIYQQLLNSPEDHNMQLFEMKLLRQVSRIAEEGEAAEGGNVAGATVSGAISNNPVSVIGKGPMIKRVKRNEEWKKKRFPRPTEEKK